MEKVVEIDGKPVKLRCTAVLPRLYRATFGRDFFGDIDAISKADKEDKADKNEQDKADKNNDTPKRKRRKKSNPTSRTVTFIENLAFLMARSGDPQHTPSSITEWLDSFDDPQAVLSVADEVLALYQLNNRTTASPKKKNAP